MIRAETDTMLAGIEAARDAPAPPPKRRPPLAGALARHAALIAVSLVFLLPFYWMVISAFKTKRDIFARPPEWWPDPFQWVNLQRAFDNPYFPYWKLLANSVFYAGLVTVGTVLSCAAVGYGFARLQFPGRDALFAVTLATMMVPPIVTFIPTYVIFANLNLTGSYFPLIAPRFLGDAFFIFMMRQFFKGIPEDLADAARIDGAGEWRIFREIMLPLVRPAMLVVAVFTLMYTWQDFFGPLIYLQDRDQFPLSLGLFAFRAQRTADWELIMMGSLLTTLPLVIVFFLTQRYFLKGIATTGLKG